MTPVTPLARLEPLPCPFCGSPAELEHGSDHHGSWFNLGCSRHWGNVDPDEACVGGRLWYTETDMQEADAIAAWNRRSPSLPDKIGELVAEWEKAAEGVTPGRWCQFHPSYAPEAIGAPFSDWDSSHDVSSIHDGKRRRVAQFKHADEASFAEFARNNYRPLLDTITALARKNEAKGVLLRQCADLLAELSEPSRVDMATSAQSLWARCIELSRRARTLTETDHAGTD